MASEQNEGDDDGQPEMGHQEEVPLSMEEVVADEGAPFHDEYQADAASQEIHHSQMEEQFEAAADNEEASA